jgi:glutathione peroxidase
MATSDNSVFDAQISRLDGSPGLFEGVKGRAALFVNVASRCGLTPQYTELEALHERYAERGFSVVGFPCNQFMGQEPGSPEEIAQFCSVSYGVTFPLSEKIEVNGDDRHPLYDQLAEVADDRGYTGDIRWNFEKFVIAPDGRVTARFHPRTTPDDPAVVAAVEAVLPASA